MLGLTPTPVLYTVMRDKAFLEPLGFVSSLAKAEPESPDNTEIPWDADKRLLIKPSLLLCFFRGIFLIENNSN